LGRDEAVFHPAENKRKLREDLGWSTHEIVAIFVGQVGEPKGMQELIEAAEPLLRRHQNFRLVCVGSGGMLDEIVEMQRRTGRHDAVSLPGTVPPEDVARYLQASDFLVFPSHSEGMPQAVLEAANCGLGAVATRVGGIPEAVIDGETGILVDVNAPDQLQQAMERMICDEGFRRTAGRNSLILAKSKFDARLNAAKFAHALKSLARAQPAEA
jgi:glycosyltransferase involved in cell wall biosynthesis